MSQGCFVLQLPSSHHPPSSRCLPPLHPFQKESQSNLDFSEESFLDALADWDLSQGTAGLTQTLTAQLASLEHEQLVALEKLYEAPAAPPAPSARGCRAGFSRPRRVRTPGGGGRGAHPLTGARRVVACIIIVCILG